MQPSPYTPGEIAQEVPGRTELSGRFQERLSVMADLRKMIPRVTVFHGPRGIGKTSLLRSFQRAASERGVATVWVTADSDAGLAAQLMAAINDTARSWPAKKARAVSERIESVSLTLGVPGIASLNASTKTPRSSKLETQGFKNVLVAAADNSDMGMMVFIDEIQAADERGLRTLAYAWQELQAERPDLTAGIFAAGLPNTAERIAEAATFSERFDYRSMKPLSAPAQIEALREPARRLGVTWEPEAFERVLELAGGYPYSVQLYGDAAWVSAGYPDAGDTITRAHVDEGQVDVEEALAGMFAARWALATPKQQQFLSAMASVQHDDGPVERSDVAEKLKQTVTTVSHHRAELIAKGLIRSTGRGKLEFTVPGFGAYIRENH